MRVSMKTSGRSRATDARDRPLAFWRLSSAAMNLFRVVFLLLLLGATCRADEGMWLFNQLPREQIKQRHGFAPDEAWTRHVMRSCVRFGSGSSASFVSRDGLILTNHHVAL